MANHTLFIWGLMYWILSIKFNNCSFSIFIIIRDIFLLVLSLFFCNPHLSSSMTNGNGQVGLTHLLLNFKKIVEFDINRHALWACKIFHLVLIKLCIHSVSIALFVLFSLCPCAENRSSSTCQQNNCMQCAIKLYSL